MHLDDCCYFNVTIMLMNVIKMIKDKSRTLCEGTDRGVAMDP